MVNMSFMSYWMKTSNSTCITRIFSSVMNTLENKKNKSQKVLRLQMYMFPGTYLIRSNVISDKVNDVCDSVIVSFPFLVYVFNVAALSGLYSMYCPRWYTLNAYSWLVNCRTNTAYCGLMEHSANNSNEQPSFRLALRLTMSSLNVFNWSLIDEHIATIKRNYFILIV